MKNKYRLGMITSIGIILLLLGFFWAVNASAQSHQGPLLSHQACVAACVLDQNIVHSQQGLSGDARFHSWYNTYWKLTNCGQSGWKTDLEFLFSVVSDSLGAPGGATMQCWQGLAGQAAVCSSICNDYGIKDAAYAPNVRVSALSAGPGYHHVRVDNYLNTGDPTTTSNAYSRKFYLKSTLQLNEGQPLMVDAIFLPSLSFPNWITRSGLRGYSECVNANFDDNRCNLILPLAITDTMDRSVDYYDGVLYDLSSYVSRPRGVSGSFANEGYIVLKRDGNKVTMKGGDYTLVVWQRTLWHDNQVETHQVNYRHGSRGDITIENEECNAWYCFSNRRDVDTYIFAVRGPFELRLPGTYTVNVLADVGHDKDYGNNSISYTYTDQDLGDWQEYFGDDGDTGEPPMDISDLSIIDLPGEGEFTYTLPEEEAGLMFRLAVPEPVYSVKIRIISQDGRDFRAYGKPGSIPVPNYPKIFSYDHWCRFTSSGQLNDRCGFGNPAPEPFYVFVPLSSPGRTFSLNIEFTLKSSVTATAYAVETLQAEYAQTQQALIRTFTEVEPNDTRETANTWDMVEPFTGELTHGDKDFVSVTFQESGIYTFGITEISPKMEVNLWLIAGSGSTIIRVSSVDKGEGVSLTFDASVGEMFYLRIDAYRYDPDGSYYQLELLDMIPDPHEPNDQVSEATFWDITQGPIEGYFWEIAHVSRYRADYFRFTAPMTADGSAVTLTVSNPADDLSICMTLIDQTPWTIHTPPCFEPGADAFLTYTMVPGQDYYVKLSTVNNQTSLQPYQLHALYVGDANGTGLTEVEPNDTRQTANYWDMEQPFRGVLSTHGDQDYILIEIPIPGIYTFSIAEVSPNLKVGMRLLRAPGGGFIDRVIAHARGESVHLTMDGSAGEQYYLVVFADQWASEGSLYQVSLTGFIHDPHEPNDQRAEATVWDIDEGPIQGYFWERTTVSFERADYFRFTAPFTEDGQPVSFHVENPGSDLSICMRLRSHTPNSLQNSQCAPAGEDGTLSQILTPGMDYYIILSTVGNKTSLLPYTLSLDYSPGEDQDISETGRMVRLHGFVHRQWGILPLPLANVPIYAHISGQPAFLLDTTNWLGVYSARVLLEGGQEVTVWPELPGNEFSPEMNQMWVESGLRQHRSVFMIIEDFLTQETPTPTPEVTDTPAPPLIQTELAVTRTSTLMATTTSTATSTATPIPIMTATATPQPEQRRETPMPTLTATLVPEDEGGLAETTLIIGTVWRLFNTGPAGVGGAEVFFSINGVELPPVLSRIDGLFTIEVDGIQPGDVLRLWAQADQDDFEPIYYEWEAEQGVNRWEFDFYSYWDEITPPSTQDQNRIWGTVWDQFGEDVSDLYLNVMVGMSDAIQRIGPTDADGYFEGMISLPDRVMVTVWVDAEGYLPSKLMFFHPYEPEDRELIFWKYYGEDLQ